jgi:hypothetical protein
MEQSLLPLFNNPQIPGRLEKIQPYSADATPPVNPGTPPLGPEYMGTFKDVFLLVKVLPAQTPIYRSGQEREIKQSGVVWKITDKEDQQPRFFSTAHVAAMYGDEHSYLFKYAPKTDIQLLVIDESFCYFLQRLIGVADAIKLPPGRIELFQKFLATFGYSVEGIDIGQARAYAQTVITPNPEVKLAPNYPKIGDFNRISISANDFYVFSGVINSLRALDKRFNVYQGFYMPPMNSGMWNTYDLLSLNGVFPEELYFHPSDVDIPGFPGGGAGNPNTALAVVPYSADKPGYRWVPNPVIRQRREYTCFHGLASVSSMPTDDETLLNDDASNILKYICYVNGQYRDIRRLFDTQDKTYRIPEKNPLGQIYWSLIQYINLTYAAVERDVFFQIGQVIHEFYRIDGRLYVNMPLAGAAPFNDADGKFNENLFIFTILNNTLKANVGGLNNSLVLAMKACVTNIKDYLADKDIPFEYDDAAAAPLFQAVISGGALFGLYTHGDERKQTKDIDMKIVYTGDYNHPENSNEQIISKNPAKFWKLECYHMLATYITYIWTSFTQHLFDNITGYKMFVFKDSLDRPAAYGLPTDRYKLPAHVDKEYRADARSSSTYRKFNIEVELQKAFQRRYPEFADPGNTILDRFNMFLATNKPTVSFLDETGVDTIPLPIDSYATFMNVRLKILKQKRDIPADDERRRWMNENLRRLVEGFRVWYEGNILPSVPDAHELYAFYSLHLPTFLSLRPQLQFANGADYRIGYFSSLFINEHGLIDYTYDSRFTTMGAFTKFSGLLENGYNDANGDSTSNDVLYGSGFHFIYESYKLNLICESAYPFDDEFNAEGFMNPFNECAPNPVNREAKRQKYKNRAERVLRYVTTHFQQQMSAVGGTLKGMIDSINNDPDRINIIKDLTKRLIETSQAGRGAEYFIGGARRGTYKRRVSGRKQTRRRRARRKSKY